MIPMRALTGPSAARCGFAVAVTVASALLAGANGDKTPILESLTLEKGAEQSLAFHSPPTPEDRLAVLALQARLENPGVAGYNYALCVSVNGTPLTIDHLLNKPLRVKSRGGAVYSMASATHFATFYSPDFTSPDSDPHYGLLDGYKACLFEFDVTGLVREGENTLVIGNDAQVVDNALVVADVGLAFREPRQAEQEALGPPEGPLPRFEPKARFATDFAVEELPDAAIAITLGDNRYEARSRFSTPKPEWAHGTNPYFRFERKIGKKPEAVVVFDTFSNLTSEPLALMQRHEIAAGNRLAKTWLAGLEQASARAQSSQPANPTTYGAVDNGGIGLIALNDVFRIHVANTLELGTLGLADNGFVLGPGATYTAEWGIIPTATPDYWEFINAARRLVDANFTIDGGFAFLRAGPPVNEWSDRQIADFIRFKDVKYTCASNDYPRYNGMYTHGTVFQLVSHEPYVTAFAQRRRVAPGVKHLVYFHCFLEVLETGPEQFADARLLMPDGTQGDYGEPYYKIYFPTETNGFGREIAKNVDVILDEIGADGVYWDEHEFSRHTYHYGEPWDGYSGDIDPEAMTVRRLRSSVTLLSEPWRLAMAKRILARGSLIGNGPPLTRAMAALKFPCFVETGSITHCTQAHLYSPIALGDHLTEFSEEHAYQTMLAALDYGCVYHWYNDVTVVPTHHHLTKYMYPFTPLELHEGCVIGEERILTNRSGRFGWGDSSRHTVHVFDASGREAGGYDVPLIEEEGKTYSEVRIGKGWSAAIVRERATG